MHHYPKHIDLLPVRHVSGTVRLPGSKSISNRTLLLSALAEGQTVIKDLLASDDTMVMLQALQKLGVHWSRTGFDNVSSQGQKGNYRYGKRICFWEMQEQPYDRWQPHWQF